MFLACRNYTKMKPTLNRKIISSVSAIILFTINSFLNAQHIELNNTPSEIPSLKPIIISGKYDSGANVKKDSLSFFLTRLNGNHQTGLNTFSFYKNLEEAAGRTYLTRKLHRLVIRTPELFPGEESDVQRAASFSRFEGKIIRKITIRRLDVFGDNIEVGEETKENILLERIANRLHVKTTSTIIERNLFFEEGDKIDPENLADNERLLRGLSHIEDARIYVLEDVFQPEFVDVIVMTRDYWSKGINFELSEINAGKAEFYDRNFAGLGRELQFNLHFDGSNDRSYGYEGLIDAANLFGTFIDGNLHYANIFNDKLFRISLDRSFYTPNIRYAGGAAFSVVSRIDNFRYPDTTYVNSPLRYNSQDYWIARSFPLKRRGENYTRSGIAISGRVQSHIFYDRPPIADNLSYLYHNKNLWLFGFAWTRQNFYRSRFIYKLGQNEDIPTGSIAEFIGGYEDNQFYGRWYMGSRVATGFVLKEAGFLFSSVSIGSFIRNNSYEQSILSIENKWFSPLVNSGKFNFRQFAQMRYIVGFNRFEDENISISDRYGIRGLRSTEMEGRQKLVMNLESVFYSPSNVLGFRFAYFAFADFGWIGQETSPVLKGDFYGGVGIGFKLRSELMVFPSLVLRLAYYPVIPDEASFQRIFLESDRARQPDVFRLQEPDIFRFR
jgi:hypothetical protein